jgi:hypothetical protein
MIRLRDNVSSPYWTDIFFTHNLDIVGQGFDYSENHLWWLINFRANAMRNFKQKNKVKINNKIRFFYPHISDINHINTVELSDFDARVAKKNSIQKSKAIAEVLKAFKVEPVPIQANSYEDFYNRLTTKELISNT